MKNNYGKSPYYESYKRFCVQCIERLTKRNFVGRDTFALSLVSGFVIGLLAAILNGSLVIISESATSISQVFATAGYSFVKSFVPTFVLVGFGSFLGQCVDAIGHRFKFGWFLKSVTSIITVAIMGGGAYLVFTYSAHVEREFNDNCKVTDCSSFELSVASRSSNQSLGALDNDGRRRESLPDLDEANLQFLTQEELEELLKKANLEELSITKRGKEMKESFTGISLFPSEKTDEHWESFISEFSSVSRNDSTRAMALVQKALREKAPYEVLTEMLNLGYNFGGSDVAAMATYLSVTEIQRLENFGVDFTQISPSGLNALVRSLANRKNTDVFDYFLSKSELVYSEDIDNVRQVLQLSSLMNASILYAKKLVDKGAPITPETKAWIENELRYRNPAFYLKLKNEVQI